MISWPWDSLIEGFDEETGFPIYDRAYKAEELRMILRKVFSNGVFAETPEAFTVTPDRGMTISVSAGTCHIQGDVGVEKSSRTLILSADKSLPRIDSIVLRWDNNIDVRSIELFVKKGTPAAKPERPKLTRETSVWELGICDILVPANSTTISQTNITDTRLETERCGIVTPFTTIDTTTFFLQVQAALDESQEDATRLLRQLEVEIRRAYELSQSLLDESFVGEVLSRLELLARDYIIYTTIDDDIRDMIDDDMGNPIEGSVVFKVKDGGGEVDTAVTNAQIRSLFE